MTKEQTEILREHLGICSRLWRWIGKNIEAGEYIIAVKRLWPEWERNGGAVGDMFNDCPICEFTEFVLKKGCDCCPLEWAGCGDSRCEYDKVYDAKTTRSKRMWANRIARLAEEALAKLEAQ